jgi:hypothetical protein
MAVVIALEAFSCSAPAYKESGRAAHDGTYDSEFPGQPVSKQLQQISESICTINCIGSYRIYPFNESERLVRADVNEQVLLKKSSSAFFSDNAVRGTATVITNDGSKIALLTCAHVVNFPDTAIAYHVGPDGRATKYVSSVAVKMKQFNFISPFPEDGAVEIVFVDSEADLAVVGRSLQSQMARGIPPIRFGLGRAKELDWGTFVYIFSYPAGIKMLSSGIVSSPRKDVEGTFYIDATVSQGSSGGIVLAIHNGIPNFQVVGVVRVVPAKFTYFLAPEDSVAAQYDPYSPYKEDAFVRKRTDLEAGVTKCIPAEIVRRTLEQHKEQMARRGYDCAAFLKQ